MEDSMGKTPLDLAKMKKKLVHAPNKGFKLATLDHGTATVEETLTGESVQVPRGTTIATVLHFTVFDVSVAWFFAVTMPH